MSSEITMQEAPEANLATVVGELFGGAKTTLNLADGTVVMFHRAKFKQIAAVTRLFQELINAVPRDAFMELLATIAMAQKESMREGRSADDISMNTLNLLDKAFGENSITLNLFATVMDKIPQFIPQFSDMSAAAFEELEIDEALLVAVGVVASNYDFFTQKLLPLLKSVMQGSWSRSAASANVTATE